MPRISEGATGWHRRVWRWHFYAGLFTMPLVIWLALTGSLYLWRPQLERWLERGYDARASVARATSPEAQVTAAIQTLPGARLRSYVLPDPPDRAVRLLVADHGVTRRMFVDPASGRVLGVEEEERRPFRLLFHLHGELLAGAAGSLLVETAACWAIVMILTGLFLWWPRGTRGAAGVLYPRLRAGGRAFWRDLHATAGLWVSLLALGLIVTGLPWAKAWGSYLVEVRELTGTAAGPVDWTIGGKAPAGEHAGHEGMAMPAPMPRPGELDRVVARIRPLGLAAPVLVSPPAAPGGSWSVSSDAADRPLRTMLAVDGASGRVLWERPFAARHPIDRAIGYGIAAHEGALFGLSNQLLGTAAALSLVLLSVSGAVMWWRRRPAGRLGAPLPRPAPRLGGVLIGAVVLLALIAEALLVRSDGARRWLGFAPLWPGSNTG